MRVQVPSLVPFGGNVDIIICAIIGCILGTIGGIILRKENQKEEELFRDTIKNHVSCQKVLTELLLMTSGEAITCLTCNTTIYSMARYDLQFCKCGDCFIDGGGYYTRFGGKNFKRYKLKEDIYNEVVPTSKTS